METIKTDLPLHDVVLAIMHNGNEEKPVSFTSEDILWRIENPEISERDIKEALDWLVRKRRVKYHIGQYTMDRYEFLDQKEKSGILSEGKVTPKGKTEKKRTQKLASKQTPTKKTVEGVKPKTFFLNRPVKKKQIPFYKILFFVGVLGLLFLSYLYFDMQREAVFNESEIEQSDITILKTKLRKMYLSNNSESNEDLFKDISNSFARENKNNSNLNKKITTLFKITDSIQRKNTVLILNLQKSINNNINQSNIAYRRLVLSNMVILSLILILFFKRRLLS